ncbi:MAG TPA: protein phosphatase 2C domain-containing protein [Hanamia sp.]|nr:protein phosphatase 2C domain-containing protein [Hanamia sp.]
MAEYFYGITDKGKRREKNEDTFFVREIPGTTLLIAGVIDGVGGYQGGDIAAEIARSVILEKLESISGGNVIESLCEAIIAANAKINETKKEQAVNEQMACVLTCVVADKKNNICWFAHVGDTRLYLLRDHSLVKLSNDHSVVGFLEESGRLSEEEAMRHPKRNEINKALGFEENITEDFIETGESPFLPGDQLLLCSDGLTDMINSATILQVMTSEKKIAAKVNSLVDAANEAGGNDNITVVLVQNDNWPKEKGAPVVVERKKPEMATPVITTEVPEKTELNWDKKKNRRMMMFMVIILIGLGAVSLTAAFEKNKKKETPNPLALTTEKKPNNQLKQLEAQVSDSSKTYSIQGDKSAIRLDAPLMISKDSFHLLGNGSMLIADSLYKGAAFIIDPAAKNIVLDSIVFKNFDVGLVVQKNNITLRHIRFINCRVPVEYAVAFKDSVVSGKFKDPIFITPTKSK